MNASHIHNYKHIRGVHCATAALRNVMYHYTRTRMSEAMVFGIASGLSFSYVRFSAASVMLTMGRGTDLEAAFCDATGIWLEPAVVYTDDLAWDQARQHIDRQELVLLDTDMFLLPYILASVDPSLHGIHFGGHKVLLTGYDLDAGSAFLADYAWPVQPVPLAQLELARNTPGCPSPPQNRSFVFHFPDELMPLKTSILLGISRNVCLMRNSISFYTGLAAIDRFCRQVARWNRVLSSHDLMLNLKLTSHMMERGGSGGGNFRNLYSRFLKECAPILQDTRLESASTIYQQAGRNWAELAALMAESAEYPDRGLFHPAGHSKKLLHEIWKLENEGIHALEQFTDDISDRCRFSQRRSDSRTLVPATAACE